MYNQISENKTDKAYKYFAVLVAFIWCRYTILSFIESFIGKLPLISFLKPYFIPTLFILFIFLSLPVIIKNIKIQDCFFVLTVYLFIYFSVFIFPNNKEYIMDKIQFMYFSVLPMYIIGLSFNGEKLYKTIYKVSVLGIIVVAFYMLYYLGTDRSLNYDDMNMAYNTLPSTIVIIYSAFKEKKLINSLMAVFSIILTFAFGTRGAIICVLSFILLYYLFGITNKKKRKIHIFTVLSIFAIFTFTNFLYNIFEFLSKVFGKYGLSTRIFDFFLRDDFTISTGRDIIGDIIKKAILEKPFSGYGIFGDRYLLKYSSFGEVSYAHNIFLELSCQFGIIVGALIVVLVAYMLFKAFIRSKNEFVRVFLTALFCLTFIKLYMSGSYLQEPYFPLLIGYCIRIRRKFKMESEEKVPDEKMLTAFSEG